MIEFLPILFILLAIYLWECTCWVPGNAVVMSARGRQWKIAKPIFTASALSRCVVLANVIPGLGGVAACQGEPPPISASGVFSAKLGAWLPFGSEPFRADEEAVKNGTKVVMNCASVAAAREAALFLESVRIASPEMRLAAIERYFERLLSVSRLRRRLSVYRRYAPLLVFDGVALFTIIFIFAPLLIGRFGLIAAIPLLVAFPALLLDIALLYRRIHGAIWHKKQPAWKDILTMVLTPPAAMRAQDLLVRHLFSDAHWLAVARLTMAETNARHATAIDLRHLRYPSTWEQPSDPAMGEAAAIWRRAVERFVSREYGDVEAMLQAPEPRSADSRFFCPRCCSEFVKGEVCSDCGIALQAYAAAPESCTAASADRDIL